MEITNSKTNIDNSVKYIEMVYSLSLKLEEKIMASFSSWKKEDNSDIKESIKKTIELYLKQLEEIQEIIKKDNQLKNNGMIE